MARLIAGILFFVCLAFVLEARAQFFDGNRLLSLCESSHLDERTLCVGFVVGGADMLRHFAHDCRVPPGVTIGQIRDVVVKLLRERPEHRHSSAAWLTFVAIERSFNCVGLDPQSTK